MKNQATLQPEAQCWTRRYEQLREQVLATDTVIGRLSRFNRADQTGRGRLDASLARSALLLWRGSAATTKPADSSAGLLAAGSNPTAGQYGPKSSQTLELANYEHQRRQLQRKSHRRAFEKDGLSLYPPVNAAAGV